MGNNYYGPILANDNSRLHLGDINYYGNQERLRHVPSALFNAYGLDHRACHPATRRDLLKEIQGWAKCSNGKSIFWLNGMAGTGKSTIAYTVAEWLNQQDAPGCAHLGASFFFKRGETDRASAALFFPTIVRQLSQRVPGLALHVDQAIDIDPDICNKALGEQFDKLLERPLRKLGDHLRKPTYVVVVDALDECQKQDDIWTLLQLWSHLSHTPHLCIQWFLTSRPELPIQLAFSRISADARQNVVLHEVPRPTIEHDIFTFLADSFSQIKRDYNFAPPSGIPLSEDWPGSAVLEELTQMAVPLFIIAATIARFVQEPDFDSNEQLNVILHSRRIGQISDIGKTYLPILERAISSSAKPAIRNQIYNELRLILGSIITAAEPLSRLDLAALLKLTPTTVALRLQTLHSVLQVPQLAKAPIRPLHLSFGEFLSSEEIRNQPFHIDRAGAHAVLLNKCLELLSQPSPAGLSENMCKLSYPGQPRRAVSLATVQYRLPRAMQYACRYWTYHARHSRAQICDGGDVHEFLQKHLLHWMEALSLLDCLAETITYIETLRSLVTLNNSTCILAFLEDARRFILANRYIASIAPLQLYSSAIIFAPQDSIVRNMCGEVPSWIHRGPVMPKTWSAELQKLEGHTGWIKAVSFSPDGSQLASASRDATVRLWDAKSGQEVQMLEGNAGPVNAVVFSPDGSQLASVSYRTYVRIWDTKTGREVQRLEGHTGPVNAVAFSPDGSQLVSASTDTTVRLWNTKTWQEVQRSEENTGPISAVAFSPNSSQLAVIFYYRDIEIWDMKTGKEVQRLEGHGSRVSAIAFSPDGLQLVSTSDDTTIQIWNVNTGHEVRRLEGHTDLIRSVMFSPDASQVASASSDRSVRLWDAKMGKEVLRLEEHTDWVNALAFSPDGSQLASASDDKTIRLWDVNTAQGAQRLERHTGPVNAVMFSPDGSQLASASNDKTIQLWNVKTGRRVQKLEGHTDWVSAVAFSPDGSQLASASHETIIRLWDAKTWQEVKMLKEHTGPVNAVVFSPDSLQLASSSHDKTIRLWNTETGQEVQKLEGHTDWVRAVAFSPDGSQLVSASEDRTIRLWDAKMGREFRRLQGHTSKFKAVAFSPDGSQLISVSYDKTLRLWDANTGQQIQIFDNHLSISQVNFTSDGQGLLTDRGRIYIGVAPSAPDTSQAVASNNLLIKNDWLECGDKKVLWLPHEYRDGTSAVYGNIMAIGCRSGIVIFLEIQRM